MEGTPAIYLGRIVDKKYFRAFIYGANGQKRLVESWDEFEANMQSGIWFATVEDAIASKTVAIEEEVKPVKRQPRKPKEKAAPVEEVNDSDDVLPDDGSVFEVTDDFLPQEGE